ncbi:2-succinyl-5-enolpyruvyl-6-hydroxy-3-cyclohexene-1-carboxylate synthase [Flavobacteriales bacterium 34_180_T64]|nr:2-succinyl-5-enolpyruvyl-6-hydroxy-3-cyclohexene-1-carboxylate synthase [Flavobacteriales bacterium 34_180_T64]
MTYPKIPLAQTIIQLCKAKHVKHIVISPGSRNAPLTIGFTHNEYFKCYSIVDERCAAFFALGIAQQLQETVALVCTSGSALLNYYPAIAEAFYSDVPLVVLSADRPKHLVGIGDGQTINQNNVYHNHILYSAKLKLDLNKHDDSQQENIPIFKNLENKLERFLGLQLDIQEHNEEEICKALNLAKSEQGPVHINCPFDEPLYERVEELSVKVKADEFELVYQNVDTAERDDCIVNWKTASRKMVLVGVNQPNQIEQKWLDALASDGSVIVLTETTSNLYQPDFFPSIDKLIAPMNEAHQKELQPDILLTFGGLIVSKKIKALLRNSKPKQHWHIDQKKANDTFFCLSKHIQASPNQFFSEFLPNVEQVSNSNYFDLWNRIKLTRHKKHAAYEEQVPYSDFKVFSHVLKAIPDDSILQLGNSSTVRYVQLFDLNKTLKVFCNRGTSGIDGSTSTAVGCAAISMETTTLITGDLSFFYDSNALWNNYIPKSFRIIVINNEGGGIFRILPGHKDTTNFDQYFETKHKLTAKQLSHMYCFDYLKASNESELHAALNTFYTDSDSPKILEVFTPSKVNDEILLNYFKFLR